MARHRGVYKPDHESPYEVSRSRIEAFVRCPACFWLDRVKGVKFPGMPPFLLNSATDTLLKKDFDKYRELQKPHPFMERHGLGHLVPYQHEDFEKWTQSLQLGFRTDYEPAHMIIGGGLDDVWHDPKTDELFIVDYKSTSQKTEGREITLNGSWKEGIRRQMDIYVWVLRRKGFDVSNTGFFLYCDGDRFTDYTFLSEEIANMQFKITWLPYKVNLSWIEPCLEKIKDCILQPSCPVHSEDCEYAVFLQEVGSIENGKN